MKSLKILFLFAIVLAFAGSAFAQSGFSGTVVDVLDGKTVVVELHTKSRITAQLQFIEVPEPEQEFHELVIVHLKELVLGKYVSFKPRGIVQDRSIVQLFADGVDISQQMIRDGAAWHAVLEKSGQDADDRAIYENTEKQAKDEKRGVWSKEGILPAWEFRVALEEQKKQEERARLEEIKIKALEEAKKQTPELPSSTPSMLTMDFNQGMWGNVIKPNSDTLNVTPTAKGLLSGKVPNLKLGYLATFPNPVELSGKNLPDKLETFTYYFYKEYDDPDPVAYVLTFHSQSGEWKFLEENTLTIFADGKQISMGTANRVFRMNGEKAEELLMYKTDRKALEKVAKAKNIKLVIGKYSGKTSDSLQKSLSELLDTTNY